MTSSTSARRDAFRALHHAGPILVLPNGWDVVSARVFEAAGFPAVATSSAALANALGFRDGSELDVDLHVATLTRIAAALDVPLTADVEDGYGDDPDGVARFIARLDATGVAGYNLEDTRGERDLYPLDVAVARIRAARAASPSLFLNARTDLYLASIGPDDTRFERTVERMHAFAEAGADGLFVPGVADADTIGRLAAAAPRPLNVLAGPATPDAPALQSLGVRRVSVGSGPARRLLGELRAIASELRERGTFSYTRAASIPYAELNALVRPDRAR